MNTGYLVIPGLTPAPSAADVIEKTLAVYRELIHRTPAITAEAGEAVGVPEPNQI